MAPAPWLVGLLAFLAAVSWFLLLMLPQPLKVGGMALIPMLSGVVLASGVATLIDRWSTRRAGWADPHRLALVMGSLPPVMLFGFLVVTAGNRVDQIGQGIASLAAMAWLTFLAVRSKRSGHREPILTPVSLEEATA